jgi:hypothetical protein
MIAFRDFRPIRPAGLFPAITQLAETQAKALADANEWIERESIEVINVESLADELEGAPVERYLIRVWYRTAVLKPQPYPEV